MDARKILFEFRKKLPELKNFLISEPDDASMVELLHISQELRLIYAEVYHFLEDEELRMYNDICKEMNYSQLWRKL